MLDETVIQITSQQYWLYAAVDHETNEILHIRPFATAMAASAQRFVRELREKHAVFQAVLLVEYAHHLSAVLNRSGPRLQTVRYGHRTAV